MQKHISDNIESVYNLSPMQQGMLFHKIMNESSGEYFLQSEVCLRGKVDFDKFKICLDLISKKHEALRTMFFYRDSATPKQIVLKARMPEVVFSDISDCADTDEKINAIKHQDIRRGFDLETDPLLRVTVVKVSKDAYTVIWSTHHIIMDGWCLSLIFTDFFRYYTELCGGTALAALEATVTEERSHCARYKEFIKWLESRDNNNAQAYWKKLLENCENTVDILPSAVPAKSSLEVRTKGILLDEADSRGIRELSLRCGVTVNTIAEAAWGLLLQRYGRCSDVVFGKVVSGRNAPLEGIERSVGLYINTVPFRVRTDDSMTVSELLRSMSEQSAQSGQFDYFPLSEIIRNTSQGKDLFHTLFAFENYYVDGSLDTLMSEQSLGMHVQVRSSREQVNYPISVTFSEQAEHIHFEFQYDPSKYPEEDIDLLCVHLQKMLQNLISGDDQIVSQLNVLTAQERYKILHVFNQPISDGYSAETVVSRMEAQAAKNPQRTAVVFGKQKVNFGQFSAMVNSLALRLMGEGIAPGHRVAIYAEHSVETICSIYAVLKVGAAYVPVDLSYPADRVKHILRDSESVLMLCYGRENMDAFGIRSIDISDGSLYERNVCIENKCTPQQGAYIIYTSGTTGVPKGILVKNAALLNYVEVFSKTVGVDENTIVLHQSSISFDTSVEEIFPVLLTGGCTVIVSRKTSLEIEEIKNAINDNAVNLITCSPLLLNEIIKLDCKSVKTYIGGGDVLKREYVLPLPPGAVVFNSYGPTECTVASVTYKLTGTETGTIPIGRPFDGCNVHILNGNELCAIGVPGELCISGKGVTDGYIGKPELTQKVFVDAPFAAGKMYRTGDLARWLPDGNIDFLGRIDRQVKIRGFRLELAEIESAMIEIPGITDAAVIAREKDGQQMLFAYFVAKEPIPTEMVLETLRKTLPYYMIPSYVMQIDKMPENSSGKLDAKQLPDIQHKRISYVSPRNETEKTLCRIFAEALNTQDFGVTDSFFDLGGNSITVISICALIKKVFSVSVSASDVFNNSTPAALAEIVKSAAKDGATELYRLDDLRYFSLSPAQKNLWSVSIMRDTASTMNITTPMLVRNYDPDILKKAFGSMMKRHSVLRTRFTMVTDEPKQYLDDDADYIRLIQEQDLSTDYAAAADKNAFCEALVERYAAQPMDLLNEPPVRAFLTKLEDGCCLFAIVIHHIILDELSSWILMGDFQAAIQAASENAELPAPDSNTIRYADYAELQSRHLDQGYFNKEKEYWRQKLQRPLPTLKLTTDFERPLKKTMEGRAEHMILSPELSTQLNALAKSGSNSVFVLLLMSVYLLLNKYSGQSDIIVGTVVNCRTSKELHDMVGYFLNTVPIRITASPSAKYTQLINTVKTCLFEAIENQNYPLGSIMADLADGGAAAQMPLFNVLVQLISHKSASESSTLSAAGMDFSPVRQKSTQSKYDLVFNFYETADGIRLSLEYDTHLFRNDTILRMLDRFREIIQNFIKDPNESVAGVPRETVTKRRNFTIKRRS